MVFRNRYDRNKAALTESECAELAGKRITVVGCGGLGGAVIEALARIGVGHIRTIDGDVFEESNLNRQLLCTESSLGRDKAVVATERIGEAMQTMLDYNKNIRIMIESKPNEPMDHTYIPTIGHAIAMGLMTNAPERVGCLIETAHALLANLSPSDEMGFALAHKKLWSVHLNDQNGLKFDQDLTFGAVDPRRALNQVRVLDKHGFGNNGEWVGLDVKVMRTQKDEVALKHLEYSRKIFLRLLEISRSFSDAKIEELVKQRDYEELNYYILDAMLAK